MKLRAISVHSKSTSSGFLKVGATHNAKKLNPKNVNRFSTLEPQRKGMKGLKAIVGNSSRVGQWHQTCNAAAAMQTSFYSSTSSSSSSTATAGQGTNVVQPPSVKEFAGYDPEAMGSKSPVTLQNLVQGEWKTTAKYEEWEDPLHGGVMMKVPDTNGDDELKPFIESLRKVPKSGMHNPFKKPERYVKYGEICHNAAAALRRPDVEHHFTRMIQRVVPKSYAQALSEVVITRTFLQNLSGDNARFIADSFGVAGDHEGQTSRGYRWPYGPVALVTPFNFPLEIPALQMMGALIMGNKPVVKASSNVAIVCEEFFRLLIACGMPASDADLLHATGPTTQKLIESVPVRVTQFTGSANVAEKLSAATGGKVRIEDAGFDWKILGPDVANFEYVAWQCDQDAYAASGQKCSAQSVLFMHENWVNKGIVPRLKELAGRRSLSELTIGPVLTWNNHQIHQHIQNVLGIPGAEVAFGAKPLADTDPAAKTIPAMYGAYEPTAIMVPLKEIVLNDDAFKIATTELFGPFQIMSEFGDGKSVRSGGTGNLDDVLEILERMSQHLTCGVVSSNPSFNHKVLANTVNGTTYFGARARTTGAPANHWFGPSGDPRGAGIGTREGIRHTWSSHREIVEDSLPPASDWITPKAT